MTKQFRDGLQPCVGMQSALVQSRRHLLQAGGLGALGLALPELYGARAKTAAADGDALNSKTPRAKACILLFMWGGPSQLDTFDLKPEAPAEVRGEFKPISTNVPGIHICEHFAQLAGHVDKLSIIRSLTHNDPAHLSSGHMTLTGNPARVRPSDAEPPSDRDNPHIGSVMAKLRPASGTLPSFVTMPWLAFHPAAPGGRAPGQNAGFLGKRFDPMLLTGDPNADDWRVPELTLRDGISTARLESRRELLRDVDDQRARLDRLGSSADMNGFQQRAFNLLGSADARQAFDLAQEPKAVRERYGRNIHGQCVLLARRLVEHGVPLVSVNWHNDGRNFWDTHGNNFNRLKDDLIPPADRALSALLADLDERGMLDETIVAWVGEFGRKPTITPGNAGREHWPRCYSGLLAGGGIAGGAVYGSSDAQARYPAELPVSPADYAATMLESLGLSPETLIHDHLGRPIPLCRGKVLAELYA